jgi:hypothetical protein
MQAQVLHVQMEMPDRPMGATISASAGRYPPGKDIAPGPGVRGRRVSLPMVCSRPSPPGFKRPATQLEKGRG